MTKKLPTNLKIARKNKNMTQSDLSKSLNITNTAISNYEIGYSEPTIDTLIKMSEKLEVSIDFLCGNTSVKNYEANMYKEMYRKELENQLDELEDYYNRKKEELQARMNLLSEMWLNIQVYKKKTRYKPS